MVFSVTSTHHATRRRGDVVITSLCNPRRRCRYVSNETPIDVSQERLHNISVVRLYNVLLERRDDVSRGRINAVPSVRLHNVSFKSQTKHPTTSQWYVTKMSQWYVSVSCNSRMKHPIRSLWNVSTPSRSYVAKTPC